MVRTYVYSAFGWWVSGSGTLLNPYHFTGRDSDTGWFTGFNYHRARYYDSQSGRWPRASIAGGAAAIQASGGLQR